MDLQTEIRASLDRANTASARLHRATDALNKKLTEVEAALVAQSLGVSASVVIEKGEQTPSLVELCFTKRNKQWGLFIEITTDVLAFESTLAPIVNASREHRLAAVRALPELIAQLATAAEAQLASVQAATVTASNILDALLDANDEEIPF
jgi:hypothetical protein